MGRYLVVGFLAYLVIGSCLVAALNAGNRSGDFQSRLPASLGEADVISEGLDR